MKKTFIESLNHQIFRTICLYVVIPFLVILLAVALWSHLLVVSLILFIFDIIYIFMLIAEYKNILFLLKVKSIYKRSKKDALKVISYGADNFSAEGMTNDYIQSELERDQSMPRIAKMGYNRSTGMDVSKAVDKNSYTRERKNNDIYIKLYKQLDKEIEAHKSKMDIF